MPYADGGGLGCGAATGGTLAPSRALLRGGFATAHASPPCIAAAFIWPPVVEQDHGKPGPRPRLPRNPRPDNPPYSHLPPPTTTKNGTAAADL